MPSSLYPPGRVLVCAIGAIRVRWGRYRSALTLMLVSGVPPTPQSLVCRCRMTTTCSGPQVVPYYRLWSVVPRQLQVVVSLPGYSSAFHWPQWRETSVSSGLSARHWAPQKRNVLFPPSLSSMSRAMERRQYRQYRQRRPFGRRSTRARAAHATQARRSGPESKAESRKRAAKVVECISVLQFTFQSAREPLLGPTLG